MPLKKGNKPVSEQSKKGKKLGKKKELAKTRTLIRVGGGW